MLHKKPLKEIARETNVSAAMVSQILNGTGRASEQVRNKVLARLEENGHRPKYARYPFYYIADLPRIEASGKTTIFLEQLSGIEQVFEANRLTLHVEFIRTDPAVQQLKMIANRKPSGVFINTDAQFLHDACRLFHLAKIPIVQIGYDTEDPNYNAVVIDGFSGSYLATRYLLDKGHSRIGMIRFFAGISAVNSNKKFAGYGAALAVAGHSVDATIVKELTATQGEPGWEPARRLVEELLAVNDPPTAIFVDNSFISLSLLYPLVSENGRIPHFLRNLEIVHFEDWPLLPVHDILSEKLFFPQMNTTLVCIDWENIGYQAAQLLIRHVGKSSPLPEILRVCPALYKVTGNQRKPIIK
ncbi:LacI family DNA-binding transcriptional regulator [candidate division KSB1 bacterium]|nr:LacI family DNA-binding transcriptional regulator [candidate division KSB1 bacterium]